MSDMQWTMSLSDKISAPAKAAAKALTATSDALKQVDANAKAADAASGGAAKKAADKLIAKPPAAPKLENLARGVVDDGKLQGLADSLGVSVAGGATIAATAIAAVGVAVGALIVKLTELGFTAAKAFATMVIERGRFREDTMAQLVAMLKSEDAAAKVFAEATKFAAATPFKTDAVISGFKNLLAGGFKADELTKWMTSIGDAAAVVGQDRIPDLISALSKLRATGKLSQEILEPLKLDQQLLAKNAGVSVDKLAGLDGKKAEEAIRKTIEQMYGGALKNMSGTLTGQLSNLGDAWSEVLDKAFDASKKGGTGITGFFAEVKGVVADVLAAMGGDTGSAAVGMINRLGDALIVVATIARGFLGGLLGGLGDGIGKSADSVERLSKADLEKIGKGAKDLGAAFGWVAGAVAEIAVRVPSLATLEKVWIGMKVAAVAVGIVLAEVGASMLLVFAIPLTIGALVVVAIIAVAAALYGVYVVAKAVGTYLAGMFAPVVAYLKGVFGPSFEEAFASIKSSAGKIATIFAPAFTTIMTALAPVIEWVKSNWQTIGVVLITPFIIAGFVIVGAAAIIVAAILGIVWVVAKVIEAIAWLTEAISTAWSGSIAIGSAIVDGITSMLTPGALTGAITAMVENAIAAARGAIDAHSPSRKFADLVGAPISEGVSMGIDDGAPDVADSINAAVSPPQLKAMNSAGGASGASGSAGASVTFLPGAIVIQASGGDGPSIKASLLEAMEEIAIQFRGAVA